MREPSLNQKTRFILLLVDLVVLCLASWVAFGQVFPPNDAKGFWFYTALLGLILGSRLDTPFFAKPADVVLYAAPAAIALALGNSWGQWDDGVRVAYVLAVAFCVVVGAIGAVAILTVDTKAAGWRRTSNTARVLAETLGAPRTIYTIVIGFALFAFHSTSAKEVGVIVAAWVLTGVLSPLEGTLQLFRRLSRIFKPNVLLDADGVVVAFQNPGVILVRQSSGRELTAGDMLAINDPIGEPRVAIALDRVGRDEGMLLRAIEVPDAEFSPDLAGQLSGLDANAVVRISSEQAAHAESRLIKERKALVGLVAPDTTIEKLFFELAVNEGVEEGRLIEVPIGRRSVTYQVVNGLTKEEVVQQRNTHGFVRARAQKIGEWDSEGMRFKTAKWLPLPNAPVFLKSAVNFEQKAAAIGHFPGTNYGVTLRSRDGEEIGLHSLVTHNTAILGILGVGKSSIALELVERMMVQGIKVVCLDLTNQYAASLAPYYDAEKEKKITEKLQAIGRSGKTTVKKNVEEGGSRNLFAAEIAADLKAFMDGNARLKVYNPAHFEVWRQDSKPFQDTASMASLTPPEITHIVSDALLRIVSGMGMTDQARVCLVYEEAHSLVPEWNSAVADGDRASANGTARAILQGRKYGLGCLLISQRTANVTKTILNQCNTVFAMRTFDETGKDFLANYLGREYADVLPNLEERHAVVFGRGSSCENPILIRANDREEFVRVFRAANPPPTLPTEGEGTVSLAAAEPPDDF